MQGEGNSIVCGTVAAICKFRDVIFLYKYGFPYFPTSEGRPMCRSELFIYFFWGGVGWLLPDD